MDQSNNSTANQHHQQDHDEIDIGQLFQKIWLRRKFILSFVFVVVLIVLAGLSVKFLVKPPVKEYARVLQLNFPGASSGRYPSGQRFSASDILASKVLSEVYRINNLKSQNISETQFSDAFSVSPYATNIDYINRKFSALLADKKLTRPEIEGLEAEYLQQLNAARARFVKVAFVNSSLLVMNSALINKVLVDIPKVWSKLSIEELGVLSLKVSGGDQYEASVGERFEYVKMLNYLKKGGDDLNEALTILLADEIGGSIRDVKTGKSAIDLKERLENLIRFDIQPLFATITSLGIVKSKFKTKLYLQNTIQDLADQKVMLKEKQQNYQLVLDSYVKRSPTNRSLDQNSIKAENAGFTQFDGGFFDRFTSLIEDKSDTKYKQKLLDEQLLIMQETEIVNSKLLKLGRALKQLDKKQEDTTESMKKEYISDIGFVNTQLVNFIQEYKILLGLRNQQVLGNSSALYGLADSEMTVNSGLKAAVKQALLFSFLATILSLVFAVIIALIRKRPEENKQAV